MKDFRPHAVSRDPSIPDEEVEMLINWISSRRGGPVVVFIDLLKPTWMDEKSSQKSWPVSERLAALDKASREQAILDRHPVLTQEELDRMLDEA